MAEDGNKQDMSVLDVANATLAATEEAQDVAALNRIVVGIPAYTDPNNPMTLSGSVNLPLDSHPVTHSPDYGQDVTPGVHETGATHSPMAVGAATLPESGGVVEDDPTANLPEDREEWNKSHWQVAAKHYGLPTSGNIDAVKDRVEEHEAAQSVVEERAKSLHSMTRDDLDAEAESVGVDPSEYSRKEDLADAILAAEQD